MNRLIEVDEQADRHTSNSFLFAKNGIDDVKEDAKKFEIYTAMDTAQVFNRLMKGSSL